MNSTTLTRQYDKFTPEERFTLLINARARGDEAEADRIVSSAKRIHVSIPDHFGYASALHDLCLSVFIELLDQAAAYLEALQRIEAIEADHGDTSGDKLWEVAGEGAAANDGSNPSLLHRDSDVLLAHGFILKTKATGWKLWCERRGLPPFGLWMQLPGFDRLKRALDLTENSPFGPATFTDQMFLIWLNRIRPLEPAETTEMNCTAERYAAELEEMFQERVRSNAGHYP
jgi:hypothetical protein